MIIFRELKLYNIIPFESAVLQLDFPGVTLIQGTNKDSGGSNGAGKSSLFEALMRVLFRTSSKRGDLFSLEGGLIEVSFNEVTYSKGEEKLISSYLVRQFRSHKTLGTGIEIFQDGRNITPSHILDAQRKVQEILKLSKEEYLGAVYLSQGNLHSLALGTDGERVDYLSKTFCLNIFDECLAETVRRLEQSEIKLTELVEKKTKTDTLRSQLSLLPTFKILEIDLSTASQKLKALAKERRKLEEKAELFKELTTILSQAKAVSFDVSSLDLSKLSLVDVERSLTSCQNSVLDLENRYSFLANKLTGLIPSKALLAEDLDFLALQLEIDSLTRELGMLNFVLSNYELFLESKMKGAACPDDPEIVNEKLHTLSLELQNLETRNDLLCRLIPVLKGGTCPICQSDLKEKKVSTLLVELRGEIDALSQKMASHRIEVGFLKDLYKRAEKSHAARKVSNDLSKKSDLFQEARTSLLRRVEVLVSRKEQFVALKNWGEKFNHRGVFNEELLRIVQENYVTCKTKVEEVRLTIGRLKVAKILLEKFSTRKDGMEVLTSNFDLVSTELASLNSRLKDLSILQLEETRKLSILQDRIRSRGHLEEEILRTGFDSEKFSSIQKQIKCLKALKISFGKSGLKALRVREISSALSVALPKYVRSMFQDGTEIFFSDNGGGPGEVFVRRGNLSFPAKSLSGGEQKRLTVALQFAIEELVLPHKTTNLQVFDEVDKDLDLPGEEAYLSLLLEKGKKKSIFLISQASLDPSSFDRVITVVKEKGMSRLIIS